MIAAILLLASLRLPLVEVPSNAESPYFAVFLSGDGGWRAIDVETSQELNRHGIPVVGLLSNEYFGVPRTPIEIGRDVGAVIETYTARWPGRKVILIGYSRGADAVPIALARMRPETRARVVLSVLLGAARVAELRKDPWWQLSHDAPRVDLVPIMRSLTGMRFLCVHGEGEEDSLCDAIRGPNILDVKKQGGHHFDRDYAALARTILAALPGAL